MNNFLVRSLTGILYVGLITGSILWNQYAFAALFSILLLLCLREFYRLLNAEKGSNIAVGYHCFAGWILFAAAYLYASGTLGSAVFLFYLLYLAALLVSELYAKHADPITHVAYVLLGQCYVALPFALMNFLVFCPTGSVYSPLVLLSLFVFIWVSDSGAYAAGKLFGKHRLFPRISPKKSWEGFFGGLVLTLISSLLFACFNPEIAYYHWISLSGLVVLFGVWGDLIESLMKRTLGVKDSGKALPGHGGFLDRLDSLLLAVYAALGYVWLVGF